LVFTNEWRRTGAELFGGLETEGFDPIPVGSQKAGGEGGAVVIDKGNGLPAVGVGDFVGSVDWKIHGVVGVRLAVRARFVAELVGAILVAILEKNPGYSVAYADGGFAIHGHVHGVVAHLLHFAGEVVFEVGELIHGRAVDGEGDGGFLVLQGTLVSGATKFSTEFGANGFIIVRGPGIEHGGAGDGHLAGEDGGHGTDALDIPRRSFEDDIEPFVSGGRFVVTRFEIGDLLGRCGRPQKNGGGAEKTECV